MESRLTDIKIRFVAEQDRLLMRIAATGQDEIRLWLTRRFVERFWGGVVQALENYPEVKAQLAPHARGAILSFEHQQIAQSGAVREVYDAKSGESAGAGKGQAKASQSAADDALDLTGPAMLVTGARFQPVKGRLTALTLHTDDGKDVTVNLNKNLLYGLCHMLITGQRQAEWNLQLGFGEAATPPPAQVVVH
jgi:hypothetical protein